MSTNNARVYTIHSAGSQDIIVYMTACIILLLENFTEMALFFRADNV